MIKVNDRLSLQTVAGWHAGSSFRTIRERSEKLEAEPSNPPLVIDYWPSYNTRYQMKKMADLLATGVVFRVQDKPAGAAVFKYYDGGWAMEWVYLKPNFRQQNILTESLPRLKNLFGDFGYVLPLNKSLVDWAAKHHPAIKLIQR